jgi:SAM-dependent methyltransferase
MAEPGVIRRGLVETLWYGQDPMAGYPAQPPDREGWNADHAYLPEAIDRLRPDIVVEVGVWKGASVLAMARRMREIGCHGVVIAVDTWLGSADHWLDPVLRGRMHVVHGYPLLYFTFLGNVAAEGLQDYVLPLPLDSINAFEVLSGKGVRPSVLHIDAGHDYRSVTTDLEHWWQLLRPGGVLIADDYDAAGVVWPEVGRAVDDFRARTPHVDFAAVPYKCRFSKPP